MNLDERRILGDSALMKSLRLSERQVERLTAAASENERDRAEMREGLARIRFADLAARDAFVRRFEGRAEQRVRSILTQSQLETYRCLASAAEPER